jgi:hypothetical protein
MAARMPAWIGSVSFSQASATLRNCECNEGSDASANILGERRPENGKAHRIEIVGNCTGFCTNRTGRMT